MKKLAVFFITLFFSVSLYSQEDVITDVVDTNLDKNTMFSNAQEWIAKTFGDYKKVIQFEDKDNGKLIIKGISSIDSKRVYLGSTISEYMKYVITIECKDMKYRYTISDIELEQTLKLFGQSVNTTETRSYHKKMILQYQNKIEKYQTRLDSLTTIDQSTLKKKEQKNINKQIVECKSNAVDYAFYLNAEIAFEKEENERLQSIISSLKAAMIKDDDF